MFQAHSVRRRSVAVLLLLTLVTVELATPRAGAGSFGAIDLPHDIEVGKSLLAEGDDLADKGETTEAQLKYKQAFEQLLPSLRKLPFRVEVQRDMTDRTALAQRIIEEIDREMTPAEFRAYESGLKALGFIPTDIDLKPLLAEVYGQEIGAFYDPRTDTMHLIREPEQGGRKPSFLESLLGKKPGFDKDENKTIIAHEMMHALADQHFDLEALLQSAKHDTDRELAISALIEGEATVAMIAAASNDWQGATIRDLPAEEIGRILGLMGPLIPTLGGSSALQKAPEVIQESLLFPYLRGLVYVLTLTNAKGWSAVDDAYKNPPLSTEQILHPEKYLSHPDLPRDFELDNLPAPAGWTELGQDVVGEFQTAILLKRHNGRTAAAGWDGDRFAVFSQCQQPEAPLGLVWRSVWDTEADAVEFASSYADYQTSKLGAPVTDTLPDPLPALLGRDSATGIRFLVERRGDQVVIVEGFSPEATTTLLNAAFAAPVAEKD